MMGMAIVHLHWRPTDFWAATPHEFWSAIEELQHSRKDR
jgi:hypothetical protein